MRTRRGFLVPVIIVLATAALAAGGVAVALPAAAAITGAGFPGITPYGGYLGNYIAPDGTRVYCIDAGRDWPSGSTGSGFVTGAVNTEWGAPLDAATIQRFNFVLTAYGQTTEPETAAAVNAYLYAFTSGWARTHGSGYAAGLHYINGNPGVGAAYAKVWATAEASAGSALVPAAALVIEMTSPRDGTVRVTATPSTSVGTLTLIGAVAADTGETSVVVRDGAEIVIRGVPDPGVSSYSISAAAQFRAIAPPGPAVTVYVTGNQQRTIRHSAPAQLAFEATTTVGPITIPFAPVLASEVEHSTVGFGERLIDSLTVTLADPEQVWPLADGVPLPIVAVGTLYGPFPAPPTNAEHPPADAPVHGTARIALTGTGTYRSDGVLAVVEQGYYTWVWVIAAADQSATARTALGDGYLFADRFAVPAETVLVVPTPQLAATGAPWEAGPATGAAAAGIMLLIVGTLSVTLSVALRREYR